jgi:hypothetical protein
MHLRTMILSATSAAALVACRGDLLIGGELDGGSNSADSGPMLGTPEAGGMLSADAESTPSVALDPDASPRIVLDASVGGICANVDVGSASVPNGTTCVCTRRPGHGGSYFECPAGVGDNASLPLGPSGGTLTLSGREGAVSGVPAQIDFAPDSVQTPTTVTLIETSIPPPADLVDWSPVYLVEPAGLLLATPARLSLPDTNSSDPTGQMQNVAPSNITIWFSVDGTCFSPLADSLGNAGFMTGALSQSGYLMVGAPQNASTPTCP